MSMEVSMSTNPNQTPPPATDPTPQVQAPQAPPSYPAPPPAQSPLQRKSPGLAVVLSFLPGLGHLYLGLYQRGVAFFFAFAAAIFLAQNADAGIFIPFVWFFGLIDAYRQAQFVNLGYAPEPFPAPAAQRAARKGNLGLGVFLLVIGVVLLYDRFYPIDFRFLRDWWPAVIVLAGVYFIAKYYADQARRKREEAAALEEELHQSP
jgi:hypothetical protein